MGPRSRAGLFSSRVGNESLNVKFKFKFRATTSRRLLVGVWSSFQSRNSGTDPVNNFLRNFYASLFAKHFDWLKFLSIQSDCLKISVA